MGFGYGLRYRETEAAARVLDSGEPVEALEDVWEFGFRGKFFTDVGDVEELGTSPTAPSAG